MSPSQVIQAIQQLLPRIKSSSAGAENILLEYANENNLEPAVLVKMAQTMNTARTLAFLEKNADSRGATFPLLNPEEIGAKYVEQAQNKTAAKKPAVQIELGESTRVPNFFKMATAEIEGEFTKAASVTPAESVVKSARDLAREFNQQRDELDSINREIEQALELREELADNFKSAFSKVAKLLRENADESVLIGEDVHAFGDANHIAIYSEAIKEANTYVSTKLAEFDGTPVTKRKLLHDRFNVMPLIKDAATKLSLVEDVDFFVNEKSASAAAVSARNKPNRQTDERRQEQGKGRDLPIDQVGEIVKNIVTSGNDVVEMPEMVEPRLDLNKLLHSSLEGYKPKNRQKKVDEAYDDAAAMAGLQKLVITDPILAEADPVQLVDMYNDLRATKPDIARNTNMLRFALREALQYGGIPQQTVKTIADIDKSMTDAAARRKALTDEMYSG